MFQVLARIPASAMSHVFKITTAGLYFEPVGPTEHTTHLGESARLQLSTGPARLANAEQGFVSGPARRCGPRRSMKPHCSPPCVPSRSTSIYESPFLFALPAPARLSTPQRATVTQAMVLDGLTADAVPGR